MFPVFSSPSAYTAPFTPCTPSSPSTRLFSSSTSATASSPLMPRCVNVVSGSEFPSPLSGKTRAQHERSHAHSHSQLQSQLIFDFSFMPPSPPITPLWAISSPMNGSSNTRPAQLQTQSSTQSQSQRHSPPHLQSQLNNRTARQSTQPERVPIGQVPRRTNTSNPLTRSAEIQREQRREGFLRRVGHARDDARWDARSDQILQMDFMTRRREWQVELARRAPEQDVSYEELDNTGHFGDSEDRWVDDMHATHTDTWPRSPFTGDKTGEDAQVDEIMEQEEREFQALLELQQQQGLEDSSIEGNDFVLEPSCPSPQSLQYGSEDEEFDRLMLAASSQTEIEGIRGHDDAMDISGG